MPIDEDVQRIALSRIGRVLKGKYRLDRVLGTGGMATVYVATHRNQKELAIKMLHPELSIRENIRKRFLREGYVANSVKHPGAVAVLDDDVAEDGAAFLVMELLEGATVDEVWEKHERRLTVPATLAIADQLLDVLAAAHSKGIVHRDLKPANLFLTREGVLKVLDFGIARLRDATGGVSTQTGAMLGTPAFMAPEQALGKASEIDAQTDLWAVGATLFQVLGGTLVHEGDNTHQLLVNAATQRARSVGIVAPDAPPEVVAAIDKALAFEKRDRWTDAGAMREGLRAAHFAVYGFALGAAARTTLSTLVSNVEAKADAARAATGSPPGIEPTWDATQLGGQQSAPASEGRAAEGVSAGSQPAAGAKSSTSVGLEGGRKATGAGGRRLWPIAGVLLVGATLTATVLLQKAARTPSLSAATAVPPVSVAPLPVAAGAPTGESLPAPPTAGTVRFIVVPPSAHVDVDGQPAPVDPSRGSVEIVGRPGSTHRVHVSDGKRTADVDVAITDEGAVPPRVDLLAAAGPPPVTRAPAPKASSPAKPSPPPSASTTKHDIF